MHNTTFINCYTNFGYLIHIPELNNRPIDIKINNLNFIGNY